MCTMTQNNTARPQAPEDVKQMNQEVGDIPLLWVASTIFTTLQTQFRFQRISVTMEENIRGKPWLGHFIIFHCERGTCFQTMQLEKDLLQCSPLARSL